MAKSWASVAKKGGICGITDGLQLNVSIPDDAFTKAKAFAKKARTSRNTSHAGALAEFLYKRASAKVTETTDRFAPKKAEENEAFLHRAIRRVAERNRW